MLENMNIPFFRVTVTVNGEKYPPQSEVKKRADVTLGPIAQTFAWLTTLIITLSLMFGTFWLFGII